MDLSVGNVFSAPHISERLSNQIGHIEKAARRASRKAATWLAYRRIWSPRIAVPVAGLRGGLFTNLASVQREMLLRTGLDVAIGASRSHSVARVASRCAGSAKVLVVEPGHERSFLAPLPLHNLEGISEATSGVLRVSGLVTIGELQRVPKATLQSEFGHQEGLRLWQAARGIDPDCSPVRPSDSRFSTEGETRFMNGSLRRIRNASFLPEWAVFTASLSRRVRLMAGVLR